MNRPSRLQLIVHADDFGLTERVNDGIRMAHERGILTSTSLLANGAAFAHAVDIARRTPKLDLGVHLTLVEDRPLSDPRRIPSLVGADGKFFRHATVLAKRWLKGQLVLDEVREEFAAQIQKVLDAGLKITHVDGHQHAHVLPGVLGVVADLARQYGIASVRFPAERLRGYMLRDWSSVGRVVQMLGLHVFALVGRGTALKRPDHFVGFYFGGRLNKRNLLTLIEHLPAGGTCELMCHPGMADSSSSYSHWEYDWSEELEALCDRDVAKAVSSRGAELISYGDLVGIG